MNKGDLSVSKILIHFVKDCDGEDPKKYSSIT